jgi:hypothetical protein
MEPKPRFGWSAWNNIREVAPKSFRCGNCGEYISSNHGFEANVNPKVMAYSCHHCGRLNSFEDDGTQVPAPLFGGEVKDVNDNGVHELYNEARKWPAMAFAV